MTDQGSSRPQDIGVVAKQWWSDLNSGVPWGGRAAIARIRRARTPTDLVCEPAVLHLVRRVSRRRVTRVAVIAGILAWVRDDHSSDSAARTIGRSHIGESDALVSEARFRRLLLVDGEEEMLTTLRRIVRHASGKINVEDLARSVFFWNDRTKQDWSYDYYNVGAGAPARTQAAEEPAS